MLRQILMKKVEEEIFKCQKCDLYKTKDNYVPGAGSIDAKIMFIGEAPGYWEDQKGKPFVGRAGKVLDDLLNSIGLKREEIYIANTLKCKPPGNRDPRDDEIKACTPYLDRQINIIKPKILSTLGRISMKYVFEKFNIKYEPISKIHGNIFNINTLFLRAKLIPMYHPAVATYNPNMKEVLMEDFKILKQVLNG